MSLSSAPRYARLKVAASLVLSGMSISDAAGVAGVTEDALRGYMKRVEEGAIERGYGTNEITAAANLILRVSLTRLIDAYPTPEAFGDIGDNRAVNDAVRVVRTTLAIPRRADPRAKRLLLNALQFLGKVVAEREDLSVKMLSKIVRAVLPIASDIPEEGKGDFVVAEAVVKKVAPQSEPVPELTERARRILERVSRSGESSRAPEGDSD